MRHVTPILLALCAFVLTACQWTPVPGNASTDVSVVITQVPLGEATALHAWIPPDRRYPTGSRVVLARDGEAPAKARVLSRGLWAAGSPAVSFDGRRVVFAGKPAANHHWSLYETSLRGSRPRKLVDLGRDCSDPAYLPDDRLVFTCADDDTQASWSLYVYGDGEGPQRITFGPGLAVTPTVLHDGRILFSLAMPRDRTTAQASGFALFTINPDGTLLDPFTDSHPPGPAELRPRLTGDGGVLFLAVTQGSPWQQVGRTELAYPRTRRATMRLSASPFEELQPGTVEAHPLGGVLVTASSRASATAAWGVYHVRPGDRYARMVLDTAEWDEIEAVPVVVSSPPRRRPSSLNREMATGQVVCYDAARSDRAIRPSGDRRQPVSLHVQLHDGFDAEPVIDAPIHDDGSFLLDLPADRALRIHTLDAKGQPIATSGWFWLRPGEVRACFGCHEDRRSAPRNHPVQALASPAVNAPAPDAGL
jgi:hypothetical protein